MRLIFAARVKNHVPDPASGGILKAAVAHGRQALGAVRPWPDDNTAQDLRWAPASGRTAVLFLSNEPESTATRAGWIGNKARAWAWTGVIGEDLAPILRQSDHRSDATAAAIDDGTGSFAVLGATPEALTVFTNVHRSEAMYYAEDRDAVYFSNSAAALNLVRHRSATPVYSRLGVAGALVHGLPLTDTTVFSDVRIVPPGSRVASDAQHDVSVLDHYPWDAADRATLQDVAAPIAESLRTYARTLTQGTSNVMAAITGGKDSRLVVAALTAEGIPFTGYTNGFDENGDVAVARRVAEHLDVAHRINRPPTRATPTGRTVISAQPELQAWTTLRSTGGLGNCFTVLADPAKAHVPISQSVNLGGQGGEIIRGGFVRLISGEHQRRDAALALFDKTLYNNRRLLTDLAFEATQGQLSPLRERVSERPARGLVDLYVRNRTGRWLATMRHGESVVAAHATLLIDNRMVRRILAASDSNLVEERLAHRVMNTLVPGVADVPFFRDRWSFETHGPSAFHDPTGWESRAPHTATGNVMATFNWRVNYSPPLADYFRSYILDAAGSPLFDVVDRSAVEQLLSGRGFAAQAAWALYSLQYTLNNAWLGERPATPETILIEVPET